MPFTKKIVAFDLDGTLSESKQPITKEMAELLARLTQVTKVAVISGGSHAQFEKQFLPFLPEADLVKNNLIIMPTSGVLESFDDDLKNKIIKALKEIISSGEYKIPEKHWGERIEDRGTQITMSALGQEAPIEEKQKWDSDQKKRQKIKARLESSLPEVEVGIGGATSIDILPKGCNKITGLTRLIKSLNYKFEDLVFVGDAVFPGGNDYSVYEAGVSTTKVTGPEETAKVIETWLA